MLDVGKTDLKSVEEPSQVDILFSNEAENNQKTGNETKNTIWITRSMAEEIGREEVLKRTLMEFLIYILFATFATIYIIGINTNSAYYLSQALKLQFLEHEFVVANDVGIKFEDIKTASDVWFYVETHMVDSLFWESAYAISDKDVNQNSMNILYENRVLGVPRMRQVRVRNDSCVVHDYFRKYFLTCFDDYSRRAKATEAFGVKKNSAWTYSSSKQTKSLSYWGKITHYEGGGFYVDLHDTRPATEALIETLKDNLWITRATKAVFVDFSVYNANINLFCTVKLVFEFPSTGGVIPSSRFRSVKLLRFHTTWDWAILVCEIICYLFIVYYILEEIREMIYFGARYFLRFWNYVDLSIIVLIISGLIFSVYIIMEVPSAIRKIQDRPKEYGNLEYVTELQVTRNNLIAVALYLIYLKAFKFLNFNRTMGQLNNTLRKCAMDILGFSMMFFIIFFAYAELGYLLFGNQVKNFSTFGIAMFTLLRTILGDFDYEEIEEANRVLAPIYFISYIFLVFFVLLNMFLAIITDTYADVKTEIAIAPDELQMTEYIQNKFGNFLRKIGLGRFLPKRSGEKTEINATIRDIREVLKKCGFSDIEIEMFFTRYNVAPWVEMHMKDTGKLLEELTNILHKDEDHVKLDDFLSQQKRLEQIESVIGQLVEKVKTLLQTLESMETVDKKRI